MAQLRTLLTPERANPTKRLGVEHAPNPHNSVISQRRGIVAGNGDLLGGVRL
jgi:hypothetical protein